VTRKFFQLLCALIALAVGLGLVAPMVTSAHANGAFPGQVASGPASVTHYVAVTGDDTSNDCTDQANPCASVGAAVGAATSNDTILVGGGVYTENITLPISLTIEGGYETTTWTRDLSLYETTLQGADAVVVPWDFYSDRYSYVMEDNGTYKMWFTGTNFYNIGQIGYATSADGITWTKDASNPVLEVGAPGAWDDDGLEAPFVLLEAGTYKMWYMGCDGDNCRIGYATSPDGIVWAKFAGNPVIDLGSEYWNNVGVYHPSVVNEGGMYKMWVYTSGNDGSGNVPYMAYATSADGIAWTWDPGNPLFGRDFEGWIWRPFVRNVGGGDYAMWYSLWSDEGRIGYATAPDETSWNKQGVVFSGTPGEWDEGIANNPSVLDVSGEYWMWYDNNYAIGVVTSTNGITWTNFLDAPVLEPTFPAGWGDPVITIGTDQAVVTLDGLTITGGDGEQAGGIYASGSTLYLNNCVVRDNNAFGADNAWAGGGVLGGIVYVTNSIFQDNYVGQGASALRPIYLEMTNSLVTGNWGDAAIHINNSIVLMNVTMTGNEAGLIFNTTPPSIMTVTNSIIYFNTNFAIGNPGEGNINADPLFVNTTAGDYHLQAGSPAINAGTPSGAPLDDLDGNLRDANPDMGVYEWFASYRTYLSLLWKN
jgi:predicted GH43/DUF377 family glycosyl hydrolase